MCHTKNTPPDLVETEKTISVYIRVPHSTGCGDAFYEPELFPALQIHKWLPVHIAVFSTGRCIITGLTNLTCDLCPIIHNLISFLTFYQLFSNSSSSD